MTTDAHPLHTPEEIRRALREIDSQPNGPARNARAEQLVALAESTDDRALLLDALLQLVTSYQFSSESGRALVPFARLLRMWDERPEDFGGPALHRLHWQFKWMVYGLVGNPDIPLVSVRRWLPDMERHYRLAGHSPRPVRAAEFYLAQHIGDEAAAVRLLTEWNAADRDRMSDCLACELNEQGEWHAESGDDERALDAWAPVLNGEQSCAEQPHHILALSLLPLLRLGRFDEARRNHLRGYRLARGNGSLVPAIARHVEFCALTGNEARGLEILAEHATYLDMADEPLSRLQMQGATALLLRRLVELGHADRPVPMPGAALVTTEQLLTRTRDAAHDLARRFDLRNGTDRVGTWLADRLAQTPLTDRLPLGVRGARLATGARTGSPAAASAPVPAPPAGTRHADALPDAGTDDVDALLAEAQRRTAAQHPEARAAWRAVAVAAERTGTALDARARAEVADHAGMDAFADPDTAVALFQEAAERYEEAGDAGESLASLARAAHATAVGGHLVEGLAELDALAVKLSTLHAEGRATARQLTGVRLAAVRVRLGTLHGAPDPEAAADALADELRALLALAEEHRAEDPRMPSRIADAASLLGRLLAGRGELPHAAELYGRAVELYHEAAVPWLAADTEARLAELFLASGRPQQAVQAARAALDHGAELFAPMGFARLHLLLAEALAATGQDDNDVAAHALEATHWADESEEADEGDGLGAWAGLLLGGALLRLRRFDEAAAVLESALPALREHHQEGQVVQAHWWLGECLAALGEPRQAGEHFLLAADIAKGWEEQRDHAVLAHLAADALNRAGFDEQAAAAYARAEELWLGLDRPDSAARAVRARAWLLLRDSDSGLPAARDLMARAVRILADAVAGVPEDADGSGGADDADGADGVHDDRRAELRSELAGTHRQTGELLVRACESEPGEEDQDGSARAAYEAALVHLERALEVYAALGGSARHDHSGTRLMAAWLEADLGRTSAAAARARSVLDDYADHGDEEGAAAADIDTDANVDAGVGAHADVDGDLARRRRAEAQALLDHVA
ncbi:tetratricopeptide repeat protein [Streptomyces sp. cg2]|uniref:tetratricopeptide repeat protein n=1 Tax=Streptomyces sp. cg2 TaxID=3238799 RepID=UPI0034E24204